MVPTLLPNNGIKEWFHRKMKSIAESLDLPAYALKRLLNHKQINDVTAGYGIRDVERLRKPMQRISDYLM